MPATRCKILLRVVIYYLRRFIQLHV